MEYHNLNEVDSRMKADSMDNTFFLIGLMNEFMNRFQTVGDRFFSEISWKQCFVIICINLFHEPPTLKELSEAMGCSHQNVKQMLIKLERTGYITFCADEQDRRKQRIRLTQKTEQFNQEHDQASADFMKLLFAKVDPADLEITIRTIMKMDETLKSMKLEEFESEGNHE